jgi:hypothetical protein
MSKSAQSEGPLVVLVKTIVYSSVGWIGMKDITRRNQRYKESIMHTAIQLLSDNKWQIVETL